MQVELKVLRGKSAGKLVPVAGPKWFIGRSEECHLQPDSDLVSRHHCVILLEEGFLGVRDLGSKNGTLVNGERVRGEVELRAGDRISVGPLEFEVQVDVGLGGRLKPRVHGIQEAAQRSAETAEVGEADIDISGWIDDEASALDAGHPTRVDPASTAKSLLGDTHPGTGAAAPSDAKTGGAAEEEGEKPKAKQLDPETLAKLKGEDSPKLAADTLRRLFSRH